MAASPKQTARTFRPEDLAKQLGLPNAKQLRAYCRTNFTRPDELKGTTWYLTEAQAKQVVTYFKARIGATKA